MGEPKQCEQCGKPAAAEVHDQKEVAAGRWELETVRHFCAEHARSQKLTFASGDVYHGMEKVK